MRARVSARSPSLKYSYALTRQPVPASISAIRSASVQATKAHRVRQLRETLLIVL